MKMYDTLLLGSGPADLDLLECRLHELGDGDPFYKHVIVEADTTFTGLPKPLYYGENLSRFARWADRIRYVPIRPVLLADAISGEAGKLAGEAWAREHWSRQATLAGLLDAEPDDVIVHGDCDEILSADTVGYLARLTTQPGMFGTLPVKLALRHYSFAVDWQQPWLWNAPSVARYRQIESFTDLREKGWPVFPMPGGLPAGWHLSWLGGPDAVEVKVRSFSHTEVVDDVLTNLDRFWQHGEWHGGGPDGVYRDWFPMAAVDVDHTWPKWVFEGRCPVSWFRPRTYR